MRKKIPLIGGIINLIESLKGDIGIIENGDVATHSIPAGSYVIWHNELYKASSAISVDDALSGSNLTAVSGGVGNELNNNIISNSTDLPFSKTITRNGSYLIVGRFNPRSAGDNLKIEVKINNTAVATNAAPAGSPCFMIHPATLSANDVVSFAVTGNLSQETGWNQMAIIFLSASTTIG